MKKLLYMLLLIICLPLIGSLFVKPDRSGWEKEGRDTEDRKLPFLVVVYENRGTFTYEAEDAVSGMAAALVPEELLADSAETMEAHSVRQEYFKALAVVCRTNLAYTWEREGKPDKLDFGKCGLPIKRQKGNPVWGEIWDEIKEAVSGTAGAVIVEGDSAEQTINAAPFFTSSDWNLQLGEAGEGEGLSLNYAWVLACEEYRFHEILKYFFKNIEIIVITS